MSYTEGYEIGFHSGGDTVSEAFSKHIAEITRIYGILNELKENDLTPTEIETLKRGAIDGSRITGNIDGSHISGTLAASQVSGELTGATIASGNVTGLEEFVNSLVGGLEKEITATPVYMKLSSGLLIQYGNSGNIFRGGNIGGMTFPYEFEKACYALQISYRNATPEEGTWCNILSHTKGGFFCIRGKGTSTTVTDGGIIHAAEYVEDPDDTGSVDFLAIGE